MKGVVGAFALAVVAMTALALLDPYGSWRMMPPWVWYLVVATIFALYVYAWAGRRPLNYPIVVIVSGLLGVAMAPVATVAFPAFKPAWIILAAMIPLVGTFLIRSFRETITRPHEPAPDAASASPPD